MDRRRTQFHIPFCANSLAIPAPLPVPFAYYTKHFALFFFNKTEVALTKYILRNEIQTHQQRYIPLTLD